jgi:YVTN family beta-propeller protein
MTSKTNMRKIAQHSLLILSAALLALGCGKDPNKQRDILLDFPSIMPERPIAIEGPQSYPWTSGRALAAHGDELFAVDTLNGNLVVLDRESMDVTRTIAVGSTPEQVVVNSKGVAFVTVRGTGEVARIEAGAVEVGTKTHVGIEPFGLALTPSNMAPTLFVSISAENKIVSLDPATLDIRDEVDALEDPRGLAVSFKGYLTVTHVREDALTFPVADDGGLGEPIEAALRVGNPTDHFFLQGRLPGLRPTRALSGTIHPGTGETLIAHVQASPGTEEELFNRPEFTDTPDIDDTGYGSASRKVDFNIPVRPIETSVTTVRYDAEVLEVVATPPVQDPRSGEPMLHLLDSPSDINHHPTHTLAFITGEGSDNVLVINTRGDDPLSSPLAEIKVGMAPKAVTFSADGNVAYVLNGHSFTVSEIDITPFFNLPVVQGGTGLTADRFSNEPTMFGMTPEEADTEDPEQHRPRQNVVRRSETELSDDITQPVTLVSARERSFGLDPRPEAVRRGQRVFTFARNDSMSHAGMFSCSTCHFEGREDKLVWIVPEGMRQTPSLAARLEGTAPFNWNGDNQVLQNNMIQTIGRLGGLGLDGQALEDLEHFMVGSLRDPQNPHVSVAGLTAEQEEGKKLFNDSVVGCASCHVNGTGVDGENHDVGSTSDLEAEIAEFRSEMESDVAPSQGKYNTPSLKGLFYTAPYLHDGSAANLMEVLDKTAKTMGRTDHLTYDQKKALVSYLKTL